MTPSDSQRGEGRIFTAFYLLWLIAPALLIAREFWRALFGPVN